MPRPRLAIVSTHPIQYNAPLFRMLTLRRQIDLKVFYTRGERIQSFVDKDFKREITWDIPLLDEYGYEIVENQAAQPDKGGFFSIRTPTLNAKIKMWEPDAVLVYGWNFEAHLDVMHYFHGKIPVLFRGDSTLLDESLGFHAWMRRAFLRQVYKQVDYALYVGQSNKAYFEAHGLKPEQLIFAPHAIDNQRFMAQHAEREKQAANWRQELGIPAEKTNVLFAGKFTTKKQPGRLLEAAQELDKEQYHFTLVGNGPQEDRLQAKAAGMPHITFLPFQNQQNMPVVYRLADVLALPSRGPGETWGLAVNEAMACQRPVLVSQKAGCTKDLVQTGRTGYSFSPFAADDFIAAIRKLPQDKAGLNKMGENAFLHIRQWDFMVISHALENLMKSFRP